MSSTDTPTPAPPLAFSFNVPGAPYCQPPCTCNNGGGYGCVCEARHGPLPFTFAYYEPTPEELAAINAGIPPIVDDGIDRSNWTFSMAPPALQERCKEDALLGVFPRSRAGVPGHWRTWARVERAEVPTPEPADDHSWIELRMHGIYAMGITEEYFDP